MFDDQDKEPEDIFADDGVAAPSGVMQPSQPNQAQRPAPSTSVSLDEVVTSGPSRTLVVIGIVVAVLVLVLVSILAWLWVSRTSSVPQENALQNGLIPSNQQPTNETPSPVLEQPVTPLLPVEPVDTDKDGLTDEQETALRTDPSLTDTDVDGLSDYDEVRVWGSDPLNADTDGDGFKDGAEVAAGYDPNLAGGRLLDINNPPQQPVQ